MRPDHLEVHLAQALALVDHLEVRGEGRELHRVGPPVGLRREAIGDVALADPRDEVLHRGVVEAEDGKAVEGDPVGEVDEGLL